MVVHPTRTAVIDDNPLSLGPRDPAVKPFHGLDTGARGHIVAWNVANLHREQMQRHRMVWGLNKSKLRDTRDSQGPTLASFG